MLEDGGARRGDDHEEAEPCRLHQVLGPVAPQAVGHGRHPSARRNRAEPGASEEVFVDQDAQGDVAGQRIEIPEPARLPQGQVQSGHLEELTADLREQRGRDLLIGGQQGRLAFIVSAAAGALVVMPPWMRRSPRACRGRSDVARPERLTPDAVGSASKASSEVDDMTLLRERRARVAGAGWPWRVRVRDGERRADASLSRVAADGDDAADWPDGAGQWLRRVDRDRRAPRGAVVTTVRAGCRRS